MQSQKGDILPQRSARLGLIRAIVFAAALLAVPALSVLTAFGIAPGTATDDVQRVLVREPIALPQPSPADDESAQSFSSHERVLRGDTVAALFDRLGVRDPQALEFLRADPVGRTLFRQLVPGHIIQAQTDDEGELLALRYFLNASSLLEVRRDGEGLHASERAAAEEPRRVYKSGTIQSSLFAATDAAGIPDAIASQLARIFATDIDFHSDLRRGDRFAVVYEMIYDSGELVAPGRIVAAEFVNGGHAYHAFLFRDDEGHDAYYSLDGTNRAKAFLRSPVEFSRISSGFGARLHPILHNWRAHTGVDFAAPKGTRVLAAADGEIVSAGWRGGYGNAIEIKHGAGITTLYGHLSAFASGIRPGVRVRQGQPIGYVGMTGLATGPHLHYEFRIGGVYQDPLKVALPKAEPVPAKLRGEFLRFAAAESAVMERLGSSSGSRFE